MAHLEIEFGINATLRAQIIKHAAQIDTGISHLNATTHTLGYICLLHGKICAGPYDPQVPVHSAD